MINYNFYNEESDSGCNEIEKYYIENYINKYDCNSYLLNFKKEKYDFYSLYYLSSISQNIINWYDFKPNSNVLQIELDLGNITEALTKNDINLTVVTPSKVKAKAIEKRCADSNELEIICGYIKDIKFDKKFDYIVVTNFKNEREQIYGENIKLKSLIKYLYSLLSDDGSILYTFDNKFAIRNFAGSEDFYTGRKFDSITAYPGIKEKYNTISRKKLVELLEECEMENYNFYYPLPDFRIPNVIFSDKSLPDYTNFSKYEPYSRPNEQLFFSEIQLFREIIKNNPENFKTFTNSFLVEISKVKKEIKYKYISYNNMRKAKYRLITKIGDTVVKKNTTNVYSQKHYDNIEKNLEILNKENYEILDYIEDDTIISKYVKQNYLLANILAEEIEKDDYDAFYEIVEKYFKLFFDRSKKIESTEKTVFEKYNINVENKEKLNYLENGFWDATFSNVFLVDDKFLFFDQEWMENNIPVEYIIYKSFFYDNYISKNIDVNEVATKYGFVEFIDAFKELDEKLQEEIRDYKIWEFYATINVVKWENYMDTVNEIKNENIRLKSENAHLKNELEAMRLKIQKTTSYKIKNRFKKMFRRNKNG